MSAADDMRRYTHMQIHGVHHAPDGMWLELGPIGRMSRRMVKLAATDLIVTEPERDAPHATYRNRRGVTGYDPDWEAEQDRIGDYLTEREREDRE